jgi:hypothetical protein
MVVRVFVGVQRVRNQAHEQVLAAVFDELGAYGCHAVVTEHDPQAATRDPLPRIRASIQECQAAIIIAFERMRMPLAIEFPGTEHANFIVERSVSAVWDHIEAAMAYQAGLPILILQERGLFQYGMVNTQRSTIDFGLFSTSDAADGVAAVRRQVRAWCEHLTAHNSVS